MINVRERWARLAAFFRREALDRDFDEELAAHIDMATDEYIRQGVAPEEARRRALARLGGITASKQLHRESRGLPRLDALLQDLHYAVRSLRRSPGFTLTAILMLALCIGLNVVAFTVTDAIAFRGFRHIDNDRLVYIRSQRTTQPREWGYGVSYPDFEDWREHTQTLEGLAAFYDGWIHISDDADLPERHPHARISVNMFGLVRQQPVIGRDFLPSDGRPGAVPVTILSHRLWQRRYGGDPSVVGRAIRVNGTPTTVVGVMAEGFAFPTNAALWIPLVPTAAMQSREARDLFMVVGRLADGVSIEQARTEMSAIGDRVASAYSSADAAFVPFVRTYLESHTAPAQLRMHQSIWGAAGVLLLIACANLANLLLARSLDQSREIAIRVAVGGSVWRIIRQLTLANVLLSAAAGVLGWWLASWGIGAYVQVAYPGFNWYDFTMDGRVFAYLVAVAAGTGLVSGLGPALRLTAFDLSTALKDGGRGVANSRRGARASRLLVVGEVVLTVVLLTTAGVMVRSALNFYHSDLGVNATDVLTASIELPQSRYPTEDAQMALLDRLEGRLTAIPGVASVAVTSRLPLSGAIPLAYEQDAATNDVTHRPVLSALIIGSDYFETLGATVIDGRTFDNRDQASSAAVVVVNDRFARQHWPGADPIGKRLRLFTGTEPDVWLTVVGVVSNIVQTSFDPRGDNRGRDLFEPLVYLPVRQQLTRNSAATWGIVARSQVPAGSLATEFRREVQVLDPDMPMSTRTLAEYIALRHREFGVDGVLFLVFAAIALLLAVNGLYAVVAHAVSRRSQEIGVRMAMGGTGRDILTLVVRQGMKPVVIGLIIGLVAASAATPVLQATLVEVSPLDPSVFGIAAGALIVTALLACFIPARRAMRVDPVVALRHE